MTTSVSVKIEIVITISDELKTKDQTGEGV
jgi:hypothetical protein